MINSLIPEHIDELKLELAAEIAKGLVSSQYGFYGHSEDVAKRAGKIADALIKECEKK